MTNIKYFLVIIIGILLFPGKGLAQNDANDKSWDLALGIYAYAPTIGGDIVINDEATSLVKELNVGGMLSFEARHPKWNIFSDLMFVDVTTDLTVPITNRDGIYNGSAMFLGFYGSRRIIKWLDLGLGFRLSVINSKIAVEAGPVLGEINEEFTSWLIPPLIIYSLNIIDTEKWKLRLRGDVGGFGFFDTFTYMFSPYFSFRPSHTLELFAGYRFLSLDHEDEEGGDKTDLIFQGPQIGLLLHF